MGVFDWLNKKKEVEAVSAPKIEAAKTYLSSFTLDFNGEKNSGELGTPIKYELDYANLRLRSWQSYLEDEVTQTVIKKFVTWIIGSGLKLQAEPIDEVLKQEKVIVNTQEFSKEVEARFRLYTTSKNGDFSKIDNIQRIAKTAYINSIVGGDVLVIARIEPKTFNLNIQLVDGANIRTPFFGNEHVEAQKRGNKIKNGIETTAKGEHVAFYVQKADLSFERIEAKQAKTGYEVAFLVYGLRYRINDNRGIPLISTVLETLKKLDRYKEATVGSAEERAKIVYQIIHEQFSTGENPTIGRLAKAFNVDAEQEVPSDINGNTLAREVAVSTQKQVFNMPQGAEMKSLDSKNDIYFKDFYGVNVNLICATIGIPPEVALSKYDSNFSASRAALKDWEHTINVQRKEFSYQFYQKIYDLWLEVEILKNKIQAPGYINAKANGNELVLEAYRFARFVGANVPHIDPLKEVNAERAKLGASGASIPLTTAEAATEALNGGDYDTNLKKYAKELADSISNKVVTETKVEPIKSKEEE